MTIPLGPPRYINFFEPFHFTAGDQLVVPIGVSHISLRLQEIQSRERERKNKRTICLSQFKCKKGVMQHCISCVHMYTNASVDSSDNSTTLLGMPTYPDRSSSLDPISCRLVFLLSRVGSSVRRPSPTPSSSSFVQLSDWRSRPTSGHAEILSPKPFVWFRAKNRQRNRLRGRPPT